MTIVSQPIGPVLAIHLSDPPGNIPCISNPRFLTNSNPSVAAVQKGSSGYTIDCWPLSLGSTNVTFSDAKGAVAYTVQVIADGAKPTASGAGMIIPSILHVTRD